MEMEDEMLTEHWLGSAEAKLHSAEKENARLHASKAELVAALKEIEPWFAGEHAYDHPHCVLVRKAIANAEKMK